MKSSIKVMTFDKEIMSTFNTFKQLRPHLREDEFVEKIRRLQDKYQYKVVTVIENDEVKAVAGYRVIESLAWGNYLYVDDLITDKSSRQKGYANILWNWLINEAKKYDFEQLHLDSGVQRHDAHRFYLKGGLDITCHHFQMEV
ncbi:GNAT family N-acetyltransferase [Metabacillus litoralis]|uniref:GNAT family N-acetyltransferase n=1 Tax=Metabacillus litoralis TaxID=152268 RepID=UPI001CFD7F52|nr:GNAT family N-acetyltransferase [Metabacillus litoralis]